jgi:ABC-type uncharacterized transport system involved in gliding motility auxiliary subunit
VRPASLVFGKYLAALAVYLIALLGTLTFPAMILMVGNPDVGVMLGGYVGAIFLGAFFLAVGIFFSALVKDQIVSFVLSAAACFILYFAGMQWIASFLDGVAKGLGTFIMHSIGVERHFSDVLRGVLYLRDILFFLSFTVIFLILNIATLARLKQPGHRVLDAFRSSRKGEDAADEKRFAGIYHLAGCLVFIAAGMMFNAVIAPLGLGRLDMTEGGLYTISPEVKTIIERLRDRVRVTYYVSPDEKMPTRFKQLRRDVLDKFKEFASLSENFVYDVIVVSEDTEEHESLKKKNINPFRVPEQKIGEFTIKDIWSALAIDYANKETRIIPAVDTESLGNIEYLLASSILRLSQDKRPKVTVAAPMFYANPYLKNPSIRRQLMMKGQSIPPPEDHYKGIVQLLKQQEYEVGRIELTKQQSLSNDTDVIVAVGLEDLNGRQCYELSRALHEGTPVVLALQGYRYDYKGDRGRISVVPSAIKTGADKLLENYGIKLSKEILCDPNHQTVTYNRKMGPFMRKELIKVPVQILALPQNLNKELAVSNGVRSGLFYIWGSHIELDENKLKEKGIKAVTVATTSEGSWTLPFRMGALTQQDMNQNMNEARGKLPIIVMMQGKFPHDYKFGKRPDWPKDQDMPMPSRSDEEKEQPLQPRDGKLIFLGCADMFSDSFISAADNWVFLLNTVDLLLNPELINIRTKQHTSRTFEKVKPEKIILYYLFTMALVSVIVIIFATVWFVVRRARREAYLAGIKS